MTRIEVFSIIGEYGLVAEDGDLLRSKIEPFLPFEGKIALDFKDVKVLTATFLNSAVGKLLGVSCDPMSVLKKLTFSNLNSVDASVLGLVLKNALQFYSLPKEQQANIVRVAEQAMDEENEKQDQSVS